MRTPMALVIVVVGTHIGGRQGLERENDVVIIMMILILATKIMMRTPSDGDCRGRNTHWMMILIYLCSYIEDHDCCGRKPHWRKRQDDRHHR